MPDWKIGDSASIIKRITQNDSREYSVLSLDTNPVHLDAEYASTTRFGKPIAHGLLVAGLISAVLGTRIPGPGAIYVGQSLRFLRPVYFGDVITATATIKEYDRERGRMILETVCRNQQGENVLSGEAELRYRPASAARPMESRPTCLLARAA